MICFAFTVEKLQEYRLSSGIVNKSMGFMNKGTTSDVCICLVLIISFSTHIYTKCKLPHITVNFKCQEQYMV